MSSAASNTEDFSFGSYGDYSGVVFYGPPKDGFWFDYFSVSESFIHPIFGAIIDRACQKGVYNQAPQLIREWNELRGWRDRFGIHEVPDDAIQELLVSEVCHAGSQSCRTILAQNCEQDSVAPAICAE
jgi:hypothetical protein